MHLGDRVHRETNTSHRASLKGNNMTRQAKIQAVVKATGVATESAVAYLEAEEWLVDEAVLDILAERRAGLL